MLDNTWVKSEGVCDSENECDVVACRANDSGIELAYMSCGEVRTVTVQGIFDICPMPATGFTQEKVIEYLMPGCIAVPVFYESKAVVVVINADYEVSIIGDWNLGASGINIVEIEESSEPDDVDEEIREVLGIM